MMYGSYGYDPFFGVAHFLGTLFIVLIIVLIVRMAVWGPRRMGRWHMWHTHSALSILNERFAKGEIDKAEYEERKKTLMGQ